MGGLKVAEKRSPKDRGRRVVVKKVRRDLEEDQPKRQEERSPPEPQQAQRRVVARVPAADGPKVRRLAPSNERPTRPPAPPPQVVKRTVRARPGEPPEGPRQVERVVVRQRPKEAAPSSPDKLESGYNYLIEEPQPKRSFEYFKAKTTGQGSKGLCISTSYPKKIIEEYGLHGTTVYWLSELEFDNQSLHPRRLDFEVTRAIQNFVKSNPSSVLIIDGVEFLILINGFERVMTFIKKMNDIMSATASTLITSINPSAFSEEKLSIIEREFDRVYKFLG
jgi:hypothetical protein